MLDITLDELVTEEQRERIQLGLAQRIVKHGITDDLRVVERAKRTILEITDDRQIETLPQLFEEHSEIGEAEGYGGA